MRCRLLAYPIWKSIGSPHNFAENPSRDGSMSSKAALKHFCVSSCFALMDFFPALVDNSVRQTVYH